MENQGDGHLSRQYFLPPLEIGDGLLQLLRNVREGHELPFTMKQLISGHFLLILFICEMCLVQFLLKFLTFSPSMEETIPFICDTCSVATYCFHLQCLWSYLSLEISRIMLSNILYLVPFLHFLLDCSWIVCVFVLAKCYLKY